MTPVILRISVLFWLCFGISKPLVAQTMDEMWDNRSAEMEHPNIQWFRNAKFGLFIHWGLYSQLGGEWKGRRYYGSGEWIMNRAKIPVSEYRQVAAGFNPINFNADQWAQLAQDAGVKYMVITAKHHEGFSLFDSKVTHFDMVDATPYKKDPLKALAAAAARKGIPFGFYYSQFQDWYEPNGGRNTWDYDEKKKDYRQYYKEKAIPQLKELLTNYGPLGILWFDTPGGMSREQTEQFIQELRRLQPQCLFSSRVGHGLGDYRDFGDSEVPSLPIKGAWESIYTHNDSWGYIKHDLNFKTSREIIQLLANVASKGGNLMLNVGPDGSGNIPPYSVKYLREVGAWLRVNGAGIYGTTYGLMPAQPWGVTTSKPGKQFLHVLVPPKNGQLLLPDFTAAVTAVYTLADRKRLFYKKKDDQLVIDLPELKPGAANTIIVVDYRGLLPDYNLQTPVTVSAQFHSNAVDAVFARVTGNTRVQSLTYSHYFGDWKHVTCVTGMKEATDSAVFNIRVVEPGEYQIIAEYACAAESAGQEGRLTLNNGAYFFKTLRTSEFDKSAPLMFIQQTVSTVTISSPGEYSISVHPVKSGKELFKLKSIILQPV